MHMNVATPIEPIPWQPYMGLGTCDSVNATNNDNASEIAADSAAVNATSPSNNGCAAGTTSDTPEPIDNTQHSLSSHPDHSDSSPQPIDPCPAQ